jgi:hypothetical protein
MNFELFAIMMSSVVGGLGYLLKHVHCKDTEVDRIHRGLRMYVRRTQSVNPEMS